MAASSARGARGDDRLDRPKGDEERRFRSRSRSRPRPRSRSRSRSPPTSLPASTRPSDNALAVRIEMLAKYVVEHGAAMEELVCEKQGGNAQFAFLKGGDGAAYYRELLRQQREAGPS